LKTINRKDFDLVGSVLKTHGNFGAVKIQLLQKEKIKEWAFLEIREKPIPFYIEDLKQTSPTEYILQLKGIDSVDKAIDLIGLGFLLPRKKGLRRQKEISGQLLGFEIIDIHLGTIGKVEEVLEMPMQILLKTTYKGNECLIPAIEPIIQGIDEEEEVIEVELPEGILNL
jgi:16S rRNA processing protein RimM